MGKSILIMGVGRSGTTAIYSLLQEILEDQFPGDVDYVYEPFLWDRATFNKPYAEAKSDFGLLTSVSLDGMYHNKQIPLLLKDSSSVEPTSRSWLRQTLSAKNSKSHYLGKMIRANGRLPLIRELAPDTRIIFIIRNPVDVLNSSLQLFSFYGDEFHVSDYPRFIEDIAAVFGTDARVPAGPLYKVHSEYVYWFYSNLAFLQYAKTHPENILCLSYETYVAERTTVAESLCSFLGLAFKEAYVQISKTGVGAIKQNYSSFTDGEFEFLYEKLKEYPRLLNGLIPLPDQKIEDLVKYRQGNELRGSRVACDHVLFNSMHANFELIRKTQALGDCTNEHSRAVQQLACDHQALKEAFDELVNSKRVRLANFLLAPLKAFREWRWARKS